MPRNRLANYRGRLCWLSVRCYEDVLMNQQVLSALHPTTLTVLQHMYSADKLYGTESAEPMSLEGTERNVRTGFEQGAAIHTLMRNSSTKRSLEVGMAYGFSTIWMIDALRERADSL